MSQLVIIATREDREALLATGELCTWTRQPLSENRLRWIDPDELLPASGTAGSSVLDRFYASLRDRGGDEHFVFCQLVRPGEGRYFRTLSSWRTWWEQVLEVARERIGDRANEWKVDLIVLMEKMDQHSVQVLQEITAHASELELRGKYLLAPRLEMGVGENMVSASAAWPYCTARLLLSFLFRDEEPAGTAWIAWRAGVVRYRPTEETLESIRNTMNDVLSAAALAGEESESEGRNIPDPEGPSFDVLGEDAQNQDSVDPMGHGTSVHEWATRLWRQRIARLLTSDLPARLRQSREVLRRDWRVELGTRKKAMRDAFEKTPFQAIRPGPASRKPSVDAPERTQGELELAWNAFRRCLKQISTSREELMDNAEAVDRFVRFSNFRLYRYWIVLAVVFALAVPFFEVNRALSLGLMMTFAIAAALGIGAFVGAWLPVWVEEFRLRRARASYASYFASHVQQSRRDFFSHLDALMHSAYPVLAQQGVERAQHVAANRLQQRVDAANRGMNLILSASIGLEGSKASASVSVDLAVEEMFRGMTEELGSSIGDLGEESSRRFRGYLETKVQSMLSKWADYVRSEERFPSEVKRFVEEQVSVVYEEAAAEWLHFGLDENQNETRERDVDLLKLMDQSGFSAGLSVPVRNFHGRKLEPYRYSDKRHKKLCAAFGIGSLIYQEQPFYVAWNEDVGEPIFHAESNT